MTDLTLWREAATETALVFLILYSTAWVLQRLADEVQRIQSARATLRTFRARATSANRADAGTPTRHYEEETAA